MKSFIINKYHKDEEKVFVYLSSAKIYSKNHIFSFVVDVENVENSLDVRSI